MKKKKERKTKIKKERKISEKKYKIKPWERKKERKKESVINYWSNTNKWKRWKIKLPVKNDGKL